MDVVEKYISTLSMYPWYQLNCNIHKGQMDKFSVIFALLIYVKDRQQQCMALHIVWALSNKPFVGFLWFQVITKFCLSMKQRIVKGQGLLLKRHGKKWCVNVCWSWLWVFLSQCPILPFFLNYGKEPLKLKISWKLSSQWFVATSVSDSLW